MNLLKKQRDAVGFKHLFEKYEFYAPEKERSTWRMLLNQLENLLEDQRM
jgi:hypothetical protein